MQSVLTAAELLKLLEHPRPADGEHTVLTVIDVPVAELLLDRYVPVRPLSAARVEQLQEQLEHPGPEATTFGEIVRVAPDGRAFAGRHLLHAVVGSRRPARDVVVILNVDPPAWHPAAAGGAPG